MFNTAFTCMELQGVFTTYFKLTLTPAYTNVLHGIRGG